MFLERFVYCVLCISLVVYIAKECMEKKQKVKIGLLGLMLIGLMVEVLTFVTNMYPDGVLIAYIFVINLLIPSSIFVLDFNHIDASQLFLEKIGDYALKKDILVQSQNQEIGLDKMVNDYYGTTNIIPCHRLDRNTSGLIIFAKNKEAAVAISDMIKNHLIRKIYHCTVIGHPKNKKMTLKAYLFKDSKASNVIISNEKKKGYVEIVTKYEVMKEHSNGTSELKVELVTGRTHQIRAHLAFIGYPILGDGKYGKNEVNKKLNKKRQELVAYQIIFDDALEPLSYLKGKTIKIN